MTGKIYWWGKMYWSNKRRFATHYFCINLFFPSFISHETVEAHTGRSPSLSSATQHTMPRQIWWKVEDNNTRLLCLFCCVRDTAWSWFCFLILSFILLVPALPCEILRILLLILKNTLRIRSGKLIPHILRRDHLNDIHLFTTTNYNTNKDKLRNFTSYLTFIDISLKNSLQTYICVHCVHLIQSGWVCPQT